MAKYRAVVGIDYPPDRRVEAGDLVTDLPAKSIKWLREQGLIELVDGKVADPEPEPEPEPEPAPAAEPQPESEV